MFSQNSTAMHAFIACKQSLCLIAQNIKICTFCSWNHILHKPFEKQEYLGVFFVHVNSVLRWFFDIICIELLAKIDLWAPPYFFLFFRLGPHYSGMGESTFTSKFINFSEDLRIQEKRHWHQICFVSWCEQIMGCNQNIMMFPKRFSYYKSTCN